MERFVEGDGIFSTEKRFHFSECYLTTRIENKPIFVQGIRKDLCYYKEMEINDIFQTPTLKFDDGIYDMYIHCQTNPLSGSITFTLNGDIIGYIDLYSPITQETILYVEGIFITSFLHTSIRMTVDTKPPNSLGYNAVIGDFLIKKRI